MSLADSLKICMELERTLYTSCLQHFQELTLRIVQSNEQLLIALDRIKPTALDGTARACLQEIIETQLFFYTALTHFGALVLDYRNGVASQSGHDEAIRQIDGARSKLIKVGPDVLASVLLAYRRVLITFSDRLSKNLPTVEFDDVRVIYVYPFTVDDIPGAGIYERRYPKSTMKGRASMKDQVLQPLPSARWAARRRGRSTKPT